MAAGSDTTWHDLTKEALRTYRYPGGTSISFIHVTRLQIRNSGNHRLETKDGKKHIVMKGWLAITVDAPEWEL